MKKAYHRLFNCIIGYDRYRNCGNESGWSQKGEYYVVLELVPTASGRPPSSALGRADEDDDKVMDKMGEDEDEDKVEGQIPKSDHQGSESGSEPISSATS